MSTHHVTAKSLKRPGRMPPPRLIAAARVLAGLSQTQLADEVGVARSTLQRHEAGLASMRADTIDVVMEVLQEHGVKFLEPTADATMGVALSLAETET